MADTKQQILDAAEALFAEHGVEAVPLRRIIAEAGVNQAAIHYHFGSRETLVRAVFARRFDPLNRERLERLDEIETRAGDRAPPVEDILYAVVAPAFHIGQSTDSGRRFRRLAGRLFTERPGYLGPIFNDLFREVEQRFDTVFGRALPDLSPSERAWRKHMAIGSMVYLLREQDWICESSRGVCDTSDVEATIRHLVHFMAAGLKAPVIRTGCERTGCRPTPAAPGRERKGS
jgi:AcrR family transcriptional regulator